MGWKKLAPGRAEKRRREEERREEEKRGSRVERRGEGGMCLIVLEADGQTVRQTHSLT